MSGNLDFVAQGLSDRLRLRRKVMKRLGIRTSGRMNPAQKEDLRDTVLICGQCPQPDACATWLESGERTPPPRCPAAACFRRLLVANSGAAPDLSARRRRQA